MIICPNSKERYYAYLSLVPVKREHHLGMVFCNQLIFSSLAILIHGDKPTEKIANKTALREWSLQ